MKHYAFILLGLLCWGNLHAQSTPAFRPCATDSMYNIAVQNDPAALQRRPPVGRLRNLMQHAEKTMDHDTVIYTIPIVFHVIHNYGPEDISKAQIESAVELLNLSFQRLNPDTNDVIPLFQPIFANCQIRFRLANIDPNGDCTDGITRTQSNMTYNAGDNVKSLIDWPSDMYLNVWVVENIASGAAGYAYYPGVSQAIDGVVILHDYVGAFGTANGSNYSARSLTHEVGHYLNLPHTWGSSNTPGLASNCGIDDGISDTPNTIGVGNFTCNTNQSTCGFIDNVQNYMDYASCHKMFTEGQKATMLDAIFIYRNLLCDPMNLQATGTEDGHVQQVCAPIADFSNKVTSVCEGGQLTFKDVSWNGEYSGRRWYFPGGIVNSDTAAIPTVTYPTAGNYDATLVIYYNTDSVVLTRHNVVHVIPYIGTAQAPFTESFENTSLATNEWMIENPDNNSAWEIANTAAVTGTKCIRLMNSQPGNTTGSIDVFVTPPFNLTGVSAPSASFQLAFAPKISSDASVLKVYVSNNCGVSWNLRYTKSGSDLMTTANPMYLTWVPNATQWRVENVQLIPAPFYNNKPNVRLKFEFTNNSGNNIYIDDINITGLVALNEIAAKFDFSAWPNPADGDMHIRLERPDAATVSWNLYDVSGRMLQQSPEEKGAGTYESTVPKPGAAGYYILAVRIGDQSFRYPVIFE